MKSCCPFRISYRSLTVRWQSSSGRMAAVVPAGRSASQLQLSQVEVAPPANVQGRSPNCRNDNQHSRTFVCVPKLISVRNLPGRFLKRSNFISPHTNAAEVGICRCHNTMCKTTSRIEIHSVSNAGTRRTVWLRPLVAPT